MSASRKHSIFSDHKHAKNHKTAETEEVAADNPAPEECAAEEAAAIQDISLSGREALVEQIDKLEQDKQDLSDRLLRTMAEFDNYRKRVAREKDDLLKYGTEKFALELLHVVDNLERALEQARSAQEVGPVVEGISMILKQFLTVLEKFNIKPFEAVGEPFDPEKHEAMAQQHHPEHEENTVMAEFQKGYFLNDKLLRPARVIVSRGPDDGDDGAPGED